MSGDGAGAARELEAVLVRAAQLNARAVGYEAKRAALELGVELTSPTPANTGMSREPSDGTRAIQLTEHMVTVMFADIRGYTAMTATTPPDEMTERMATFYRWARQEVQERGGHIDEFRGDSVMATFNVTSKRLDHCLLALQAALALSGKAALMGLGLGTGIAVGPAVAGAMTQDERITVLGHTVNLAARLQATAAAGEVLLSEDAYARVKDWAREHDVAAVVRRLELKGIHGSTTLWAIPPRFG
jgi:class 3 adenylate cyclase